jgi:uncharacterized membrane protein SpoIIM required for sporulation
MNQDSFTEKYQPQWKEFERWLDSKDREIPKDRRPLSSDSVDIPHMYRQLCHHLSLAQSRNYSAHLIEYLNQLTLRGHQHLYRAKSNTISGFVNFVFYEFPSLIRKEWRLFWLATLLFYGPLFGIGFAIQENPELVYSIMPPEQVSEFRSMYDPEAKHIGTERASDDDFYMFGFYIYNNISVGFRTFAGGMLFGLGSIFFLVYNGLAIGAVAGHLIQIGYSETFLSFVIGHGSFELTAIIIAGMAGLKLGFAMIRPGLLSRSEALKRAGKVSLKMVYGVILMLVIAAFLEAFWSSKGSISPDIKYIVGYFLWGFVGIYLLLIGRRRAD